jgi:hypothetical protein
MGQRVRTTTLAAVLALTGVAASPADATTLCWQTWCRKAEALVQHWLGRPANRDPEITRPPRGIDPGMALVPPGPPGMLRIIRPRRRSEQQ